MATTRTRSSRIPVCRSFTASVPTHTSLLPSTLNSRPPTYKRPWATTPHHERVVTAMEIRLTCSTPTFNQSTKFGNMASHHTRPVSPIMQRGKGIGNLRRYTDSKSTLATAAVSIPARARSALSTPRLPRFRLRFLRSEQSLVSSVESSDASSSRSSSPEFLQGRPNPHLPPLFSRCKVDISSTLPARTARRTFKIHRKPAPEYRSPSTGYNSDSTSTSYDSSVSQPSNELQIIGPNVFIAYDDEFPLSLATAFTHIIRITPATSDDTTDKRGLPPSRESFDSEKGIHTFILPILPPSSSQSKADKLNSRFTAPRRVRRKPVPSYLPSSMLPAGIVDSTSWLVPDHHRSRSGPTVPNISKHPKVSNADLVATQQFFATLGRHVSLSDLERFLSETVLQSGVPPLGLHPSQIADVLSFLRPHPFAPEARKRVLVLTPRGQLAREGLALMACYLAGLESCSVSTVLRKFEASVGTVAKSWRGVLGGDDVVSDYLEELLVQN